MAWEQIQFTLVVYIAITVTIISFKQTFKGK